MRLVSAIRGITLMRLPSKRPIVQGTGEMVFVAPQLKVAFGEPFEVSEAAGEMLLKRWRRRGLALVGAGMSDDQALAEARQTRRTYLQAIVNDFRTSNARCKASGIEVSLPKQVHLDALRELKFLADKLTSEEKELMDLSQPRGEGVQDLALSEMGALGLTPQTAPLVPGVESELLGL